MQNLLALDQTKLAAWFQAELGEPAFRARQVMQWIYQKGVRDFAQMSDISKTLRAKLETHAEVRLPEVALGQHSTDGTQKWVLKLDDPKYQAIETVFIPEDDRGTLCISSQVGCAMDCQFCSTAVQGFSRNLSPAEIIGQVWWASDQLRQGAPWSLENRPISNVVFMGMGEPLANFESVITSLNILLDDFAFGLSKRKVTISTAGLVPFIDRLRERTDCALAVSLHAPNDEVRDEIVPLNKKYPIAELMAACDRYTDGKDRKIRILYEYVMLKGVNDRPEHARQLAKLLANRPAKVNLIPFNPFPGAPYERSSNNAIHAFRQILTDGQITNTVRKTRGDDIDAACGQLVGKVQNRQRQTLGQRK